MPWHDGGFLGGKEKVGWRGDGEKEEIEMIMDDALIVSPRLNIVYEVLERKGDEELPPPNLKPLPKGLMYEFMDNTERFPIIVNADLSGK